MPRTRFTFVLALTLFAAQARAQAPGDVLPPDAEHAVDALNASPRHGEWVTVSAGGADSLRAWVVYPERSGPAPVVVVIHEIFGLTNWVRAVADDVAKQGYLAVAPDLLSGQDIPTTGAGDPERQAAVAAIRELDADQVQRRIRAAAEYAMGLPAAQPRYATLGFCWGGTTSFQHATRYADSLMAAIVFYGTSPDSAALGRVRTPVLGLYGGDDARVTATVPRAESVLGGRYTAHVFPGAGHGFARQQSGRDGANLEAIRQAWPSVFGFLRGIAPGGGSR